MHASNDSGIANETSGKSIGSPQVRFASANEEFDAPIAPISSDRPTTERSETDEEKFKELSQNLRNAQLQGRRMSQFAFEPVSLPASRVSVLTFVTVVVFWSWRKKRLVPSLARIRDTFKHMMTLLFLDVVSTQSRTTNQRQYSKRIKWSAGCGHGLGRATRCRYANPHMAWVSPPKMGLHSIYIAYIWTFYMFSRHFQSLSSDIHNDRSHRMKTCRVKQVAIIHNPPPTDSHHIRAVPLQCTLHRSLRQRRDLETRWTEPKDQRCL